MEIALLITSGASIGVGAGILWDIYKERKRKRQEWMFVKWCQDNGIKVHAAATPDGKIAMVADFSANKDLDN